MPKQNFLDPQKLLIDAGFKAGMTIVDLGSGNGFFTIPAARIAGDRGSVWAVDILEDALSQVVSSARLQRLKNIRTLRCDLENPGDCRVPDLSCDAAIIGKILPQMRRPDQLIRESWRMLKTGGWLLLVEWRRDQSHFGPPQQERLDPAVAQSMLTSQGFKFVRECPADPYHFAFLFQK